MKILILLVCSFISLTLFAQMPAGGMNRGGTAPTGRFYGRIVDAANKGIEAASVTLVKEAMDTVTKQKKEVIVGGMLTTLTGDFSIEEVPLMGRYKLKVTGIGYKTIENTVAFEMPKGGGGNPAAMLGALDKDLGNLKLVIDDKLLAGVTVTATKPLLQMGIDRKIFNVDRNIVSQGGTAIDVMKNVPSVSVDIDGNVTLRNNAPTIFVDGRPTNLTLEQIPADAIESVEIITNPSAKFDASGGTAGILNIVLKKNKRVGYSGNIRANIDSRAKVGFGGDVNVRQNKLNFFASGMVNQRKSISSGETVRRTFDSLRTLSTQKDKTTMEGIFGFGRGGFDYFINNRNTLTLSGSMARGKMSPNSVSDIFINEKNADVAYNPRFSNSENRFNNMGTQMSFKHNFPKAGNEWTADVTYNKGHNESEATIRTENYVMPSRQFKGTYNQFQNTTSDNENIIFQTDYANPINDKSKFELGSRVSIRKINSLTNYLISSKTSSTAYDNEDRVYAAYGTYTNRIKDFGYQLGFRAESSSNEGILNFKQSYKTEFPISLFPSVFLSQKLGESDDLQFNYSRRINRPNFFQLFPFTDYSDSFNISRGNPNLKPEFTNSLELSYSKIFENRDNFIASIYFKNTNNLITRIITQENDTFLKREVFVSSFVNANRSYVTGLELTGRNKITKWWDLTTNANLFTAKIDLDNQPDADQFLSYFIKINNSFKLPKNLTLQLSGDYQSKIVSSPGGRGSGGGGGGMFGGGFGGGGASAAQGYIRPNYGIDAALRFEFLKEKTASLSLSMNDILRTKKYDSHTEQSGLFVQDSWRRRDPQVVRLNFNYRFGKFDASLFKRKNTRTEDAGMEGANF
ncbi:MAG TPA: TonB-dependent receptor [Chitinophagaceae bacterium]|nr:TonB-dependent receptor [Chitinophagaceae bacterium]